MDPSIRSIRQPAALEGLEEATVKSVSGSAVLVSSSRGVERATQAVSCLVKPCAGDTVLLSRIAPSRLYVLAILERTAENGQDVALEFKGSVSISSEDEVAIGSKRTRLSGQQLDLTGRDVSVAAKTFQSFSDSTQFSGNRIRMVSQTLDVVTDRLSRHVKALFSMVTGHEIRKSQHVTEQVTDSRYEQSKNTIIDVRNDLKMNADRIHMG